MTYSQNWNIDVVFPGIDSPELNAAFKTAADDNQKLAETIASLTEQDENSKILAAADSLQTLEGKLGTIGFYLNAWRSVNYGKAEAGPKFDRLSKIDIDYTAQKQAWGKFLAALSDKRFQSLSADEKAQPIAFILNETRQQAAKLLDDNTEKLINEFQVDALHAWSAHYDTISAGLSTSYTDAKGQKQTVSAGQALNLLDGIKDKDARADLMKHYESMWGKAENLSADTLNHLAGARLTDYKAHGINDYLEKPLELNRLSRASLTAMWNTVAKNEGMLVKFFARKAKLLGLDSDQISWQDQTAPVQVPGYEPRTLSYDDTANFIVKNFSKYSAKMGAFAKHAFENQWIESEDRPGKQPGGWDESIPALKEDRIFLTFTGSVNDAATIAHELGHAFHSRVLYDLPQWRQNYAMNVAETASTFAEAVINTANVEAAKTDAEKITLLDAKMANATAMFMNIRVRFIFENNFYKARQEGVLMPAQLNKMMVDAQKEAFAGALSDDGVHPHFWTSKLHFYIDDVPFYNFPYTFGYLFSLGIFAWAQKQTDFESAYIALLRDTANMSSEELAKKHLGVDLTQPDFWQAGADLIKKDVDEFLRLTENI
ncbi:M3 family oligoendopeptidase [Oenococcus sicerae]|uniref:M3 family oligoendopeptidase n=1 Tax=Oenococcus sicerae TaxID=2203724 RepID=A0ABX5QM38_9LACO|nr:M3 family oligoendopeptidase [Oenococcus sicerae]QAS69831.1 M3 family oligoendopeptidase [Oenococcus sicerae]